MTGAHVEFLNRGRLTSFQSWLAGKGIFALIRFNWLEQQVLCLQHRKNWLGASQLASQFPLPSSGQAFGPMNRPSE